MLTATALLWTRIGAGFFLFIAGGLLKTIRQRRNDVAKGKSWPTAFGQIISSEIEIPEVRNDDEEPNCRVNVCYSYQVDAANYVCDRIAFGAPNGMTLTAAETFVAKYAVGTPVRVHYDPRHPHSAVLHSENQKSLGIWVAFSIFAAIGAVLSAHSISGRVLYTDNGVPMFAYLMPVAAFVIACFGIYGFLEIRRQQNLSIAWPTTQGRITSSRVIEVEETDGDNDTVIKYCAKVAFAYRLGSREFNGTTRKWGWTELYSTPKGAESVVAQYPVGHSVPVYYDPASPALAVLEPDNRVGSYAPLFFSGGFGLAAFVMLWCFAHAN
jgi:Protein of unknown function (DUF3592)